MNRITDKEGCIGKTIAAISGYGDEYLIAFSDKSFITIGIERGYEDSVDITFVEPGFNRYNLVETGLLTVEEYEAEIAAEQEEWRGKNIEGDRRVYKILKARFEPGRPSHE